MRDAKGKLICTWSPVLHGEGCSTLACGIGFGLQHKSGKRVLIVNKSNSTSHMERYVENDIQIKYSMDNLKIFNTGIRAEHILTYATQVNERLYMIAGSRFRREITKEDTEFDMFFLDRCLEAFDVVIADIDTGVREENRLYLQGADYIISVFTPNEIIVDELHRQPEMKDALYYFADVKTLKVINKLYEGWDVVSVVERFKSKYSLSQVFGLIYDGDVLNACCSDKELYSFLMKEIKRGRNSYVKQLTDICSFLGKELSLNIGNTESLAYGGVFKRLLRSSMY